LLALCGALDVIAAIGGSEIKDPVEGIARLVSHVETNVQNEFEMALIAQVILEREGVPPNGIEICPGVRPSALPLWTGTERRVKIDRPNPRNVTIIDDSPARCDAGPAKQPGTAPNRESQNETAHTSQRTSTSTQIRVSIGKGSSDSPRRRSDVPCRRVCQAPDLWAASLGVGCGAHRENPRIRNRTRTVVVGVRIHVSGDVGADLTNQRQAHRAEVTRSVAHPSTRQRTAISGRQGIGSAHDIGN
jgi:hypothetical protein